MKKLMKGITIGLIGLAVGWLSLVFAPQAQADITDPTTLRYVCTSPTVCTAGPTTQITTSASPTFDITNTSGSTGISGGSATLHVIVLVPDSAPTLTFSISGTPLGAVSPQTQTANLATGTFSSGMLLDGTSGFFAAVASATGNPNFSAFASASGQSGTTPTGFTVYVASFSLSGVPNSGPATYLSGGSITGISGLPAGTILYAALSTCTTLPCNLNDSSTTVRNTTPLSESVTITEGRVSQPSTLLLLGVGLVGLGFLGRRKKLL